MLRSIVFVSVALLLSPSTVLAWLTNGGVYYSLGSSKVEAITYSQLGSNDPQWNTRVEVKLYEESNLSAQGAKNCWYPWDGTLCSIKVIDNSLSNGCEYCGEGYMKIWNPVKEREWGNFGAPNECVIVQNER